MSQILFWSTDPSILINKNYITELWPTSKMTFEQKLNAISRLVIVLTVLGFIFTTSVNILLIGVVTLVIIIILNKINGGKQKVTKETLAEGFSNNNLKTSGNLKNSSNDAKIINPDTLQEFLKSDFESTSKLNPFSNVLLTDIYDNPDRKAAPPAFNTTVSDDIVKSTKRMVQRLNPEIKNTNKQLFGDLGENFNLDQSNRNFYSTANTRVANDQGAYSQFLYSEMYSAKESGVEGAMQRIKDNPRYNLY